MLFAESSAKWFIIFNLIEFKVRGNVVGGNPLEGIVYVYVDNPFAVHDKVILDDVDDAGRRVIDAALVATEIFWGVPLTLLVTGVIVNV
jgi:hypothetical protein